MAGYQLAPYPRPLGIWKSFIAPQGETLVLKEKIFSLTRDSFSIQTVDGRHVVQAVGESFTFSNRKHIMDLAGNTIFDLRKQPFSFPSLFYGQEPGGKRIFEVKGKISFPSSKQVCTFYNPIAGREETLIVKGNFIASQADIICQQTGQVVAHIDREYLNVRQILGGNQTYVVTIAPNVDVVLIAAMCISLDEKRTDRNGTTSVLASMQ